MFSIRAYDYILKYRDQKTANIFNDGDHKNVMTSITATNVLDRLMKFDKQNR